MWGLPSFIRAVRVFKYRDRVAIISDILTAIKKSRQGRKKTQIMQSANLNYIQTKKYLNYLYSSGLIEITERETYVITEDGSKFLQTLEIQRTRLLK